MKGATHFIEVFKIEATGKVVEADCFPVKHHDHFMQVSNSSSQITTIAVWFIKEKQLNNPQLPPTP
jgi:hypothetical protein